MMTRGGWRKLGGPGEAAATLLKTFLIARGEGVDRTVWYSWDNIYGLGMLEPTSREPKPIISGVRDAVSWLAGKSVKPCGIIANAVWSCELVDARGNVELVVWSIASDLPQRWVPPSRSGRWLVTEMGGAQPKHVPHDGVLIDGLPRLFVLQ